MNEPKPFASLTSGLLARKGDARPAMRPQAFTHPDTHADDLGWNDMGHDEQSHDLPEHVPSSIAALTPAPRVPTPPAMETAAVVEQQRALEATFASEPPEGVIEEREDLLPHPPARPAEVVALPPRRTAASPAKGKCAFTLRLDEERHLRLRLATAVQNRSAQRIVTEALDAYLNALPELDTLAQQVPVRSGHRS